MRNTIIDIHVHPRLNKRPVKAMEEMIRAAANLRIGRICLLGDVLRFGWNPSEEQIRAINTLTIRLVKRWPETLTGFCFLNALHSPRFCFAEMERCIVGAGFKGIKFEVSTVASDKRLDPLVAKAAELDAVVLHHCWDNRIIGNRRHQSDSTDVARLAARHPNAKIVMAHLTGVGIRGVRVVKDLPNVYVDTSGSQPFADLVEYAVQELGAERLVFGSDAPGRDFSCQLGRITGARITERQRRLILGGNAERLLGI
ncbi:MAG: amidohydrolase family protein [Kiritimatiellae bacterium]|nr:amidohydrolase family protein [Kiritimatiellia bacterium]